MENKIKPYEIYTALKIIKMVCEGVSRCELCPLKSTHSNILCGLRDIPANWKIKDYNEYNAFQ